MSNLCMYDASCPLSPHLIFQLICSQRSVRRPRPSCWLSCVASTPRAARCCWTAGPPPCRPTWTRSCPCWVGGPGSWRRTRTRRMGSWLVRRPWGCFFLFLNHPMEAFKKKCLIRLAWPTILFLDLFAFVCMLNKNYFPPIFSLLNWK